MFAPGERLSVYDKMVQDKNGWDMWMERHKMDTDRGT